MYAIAIQVKDYGGKCSSYPVEQVNKSDSYDDWHTENLRIIEKWVITTKASKEENEVLENAAKNCEIPVKILFAEDLKKLLYKAAMAK